MKIGDKVQINVTQNCEFNGHQGVITGQDNDGFLVQIEGHKYEYSFSEKELVAV